MRIYSILIGLKQYSLKLDRPVGVDQILWFVSNLHKLLEVKVATSAQATMIKPTKPFVFNSQEAIARFVLLQEKTATFLTPEVLVYLFATSAGRKIQFINHANKLINLHELIEQGFYLEDETHLSQLSNCDADDSEVGRERLAVAYQTHTEKIIAAVSSIYSHEFNLSNLLAGYTCLNPLDAILDDIGCTFKQLMAFNSIPDEDFDSSLSDFSADTQLNQATLDDDDDQNKKLKAELWKNLWLPQRFIKAQLIAYADLIALQEGLNGYDLSPLVRLSTLRVYWHRMNIKETNKRPNVYDKQLQHYQSRVSEMCASLGETISLQIMRVIEHTVKKTYGAWPSLSPIYCATKFAELFVAHLRDDYHLSVSDEHLNIFNPPGITLAEAAKHFKISVGELLLFRTSIETLCEHNRVPNVPEAKGLLLYSLSALQQTEEKNRKIKLIESFITKNMGLLFAIFDAMKPGTKLKSEHPHLNMYQILHSLGLSILDWETYLPQAIKRLDAAEKKQRDALLTLASGNPEPVTQAATVNDTLNPPMKTGLKAFKQDLSKAPSYDPTLSLFGDHVVNKLKRLKQEQDLHSCLHSK